MSGSALASLKCVVFDVDDTLYLERDYVRSGFEAVGQHLQQRFGTDGFFQRAWDAFEHGARGTVFNQVLAQCGVKVDADLVTELIEVYRTHTPNIGLIPDARKTIQQLHGRVALCAITDGPKSSQQAKVDTLGLSQWIDPIVLTETLGPGHSKPHPLAFERVEQATGCRGKECVYIGDNPAKDFKAPRALGWQTVRIRRPGGLHREIASGGDVGAEVVDLLALLEMFGIDG